MRHIPPDSFDQIMSGSTPVEEQAANEKKQVLETWDRKEVPRIRLMQALAPTSWARKIKGAYAQALEIRGEGSRRRLREKAERKRRKALCCGQTCTYWIGCTLLVTAGLGVVLGWILPS